MFGLDNVQSTSNPIPNLAYNYCKLITREASFLDRKPSLLAAASILVAINICISDSAPSLGITKISEFELKYSFFEASLHDPSSDKEQAENQSPLRFWNKSVSRVTQIEADSILPVYSKLTLFLNQGHYNHKLSEDILLSCDLSDHSEDSLDHFKESDFSNLGSEVNGKT